MASGSPEGESRSLLERFREGDEEAFRTLFERHAVLLERAIQRRIPRWLQRRFAASDVIQETRLVAFLRRGDFEMRGPDAFRRWIFGIGEMKLREAVRRHAGTAKRAAHLDVTRGQRVDTAHVAGPGPTPSQVAISAETADCARRALERLSPDDQQVLRLTREEGLSLREVGERMGRSPDAVRMLCGRAMCRFKKAFEEVGGGGHEEG